MTWQFHSFPPRRSFSGKCACRATAFRTEPRIVSASGLGNHGPTEHCCGELLLWGISHEKDVARSDRRGGFHRVRLRGRLAGPYADEGCSSARSGRQLDRLLYRRRRRLRHVEPGKSGLTSIRRFVGRAGARLQIDRHDDHRRPRLFRHRAGRLRLSVRHWARSSSWSAPSPMAIGATSQGERSIFPAHRHPVGDEKLSSLVGSRRPCRLARLPATADLLLGRLHRGALRPAKLQPNLFGLPSASRRRLHRPADLQGLVPRRWRRICARTSCPACSGRPSIACRSSTRTDQPVPDFTRPACRPATREDSQQVGADRPQRAGLSLQLGRPGGCEVLIRPDGQTTESPGIVRGFLLSRGRHCSTVATVANSFRSRVLSP